MKRLNSRVDAIERQAGNDGELSPAEKQMLVSVLARRDALFWPWRVTSTVHPPIPEIRQRQREYLAGIVGIAAKADGRHAWKDSHALRQSLIASGHLTATQSSGQITSMFLTPAGEATGRGLVGDRLATNADAWIGLAFLRVLSECPGSPVRESVLFGLECTGDPSDWEHRVERILPLLTSGVARADSDTCGRVLYSLVDGTELPEPIAVNIEPEDGFDELYIRSFNNERAVLENAEPRDPSGIYMPKSASLYWPKTEETTDEE